MTDIAPAPLSAPTLLGAVAKLVSAGHGAEDTLTGVADILYRGLPAEEVSLWLREPGATEFRAIVSPPREVLPARRTSAGLRAVTGGADDATYRFDLVHEGERLGMLEARAAGAFSPERVEILQIAADILAPFLASIELSEDLAQEVALRAREIEEQRRFIAQVIDSLPVGLYVVDREYRVTLWNRMRETGSQGLPREEAMGRPVFEVLSRQEKEKLQEEFDAVFTNGRTLQVEIASPGPLDTRYYRITKIPMRDSRGEVSHVITIGEDLTEWRSAQARILQAEKLAAVGQLAAGVMHEINNPLATIGACVEALTGRLAEGAAFPVAQAREYLEIIEKEVQRCTDIVDGLLDFSRPKATVRRPVSLSAVLEDVLFLLKHHSRFKRMTVELDLATDLPDVLANQEQLVQVFMALLLNAVDAMEGRGGAIGVRTARNPDRPDEVMAEVRDSGQGMTEADLGKIFEPFYTTKPPGRGTGLGLSICYGLVQQHRGRIAVDSTPGQGSTFRVYLPIAAEATP
ncbi:MAG TPA: ATP-binding protein [Gemmatimonadales bacterium]|nr:ATP-binding protein [Gemmatimonadales bacterium]